MTCDGSLACRPETASGLIGVEYGTDCPELAGLLQATGTSLLDLHGVGPTGAARALVEAATSPGRNHFASWTGTAPNDASSGDHVRHRLSRGGNRQINRTLHTMAVVQLRNSTDGRAETNARRPPGSPRWKRCAA